MKPPSPSLGRHDAIQQHGLDRVLDRFGAGVDDEVARRAGRRDAVQLGLEPQRQHGLVLGMRVARRDERQRLEHGARPRRVVLAERLGGDQRAHVEEAVRLAVRRRDRRRRGTARPTSAGSKATGSEKNRLREAACSAACDAGRCCSTSVVERALAVVQRLGHVRAHLAGPVCAHSGAQPDR